MLASATAYDDGVQAAWRATAPDGIPTFGEADRKRLTDVISAIVLARRAVEELLRK